MSDGAERVGGGGATMASDEHRHEGVMHEHPMCHGMAYMSGEQDKTPFAWMIDGAELPSCLSCGRPLRGAMVRFVDGSVRAYS